MAKPRSYKLLCPIARALDRVGDRWTLLILRDLHAGAARFSELQQGLTGIAANLLTERLGKLSEDGLIRKTDGGHRTTLYELTEEGCATGPLIFELARLGASYPPGEEIVQPGNHRTVLTTLAAAARRAGVEGVELVAGLAVDGEEMRLTIRNGTVTPAYGTTEDSDLVVTTGFEDILSLAEGEISLDTFAATRATLDIRTPGADGVFVTLMTRVLATLQDHGSP